jgi:hypothetical protein
MLLKLLVPVTRTLPAVVVVAGLSASAAQAQSVEGCW